MGLIYLDSSSANDSYTGGSSPVGTGGIDLVNSTCKIHAATSTATAGSGNSGSYGLELILDVEFLQLGTQPAPMIYYMYEAVEDNKGVWNPVVNGGNTPWSSWGYWPAWH